MSKTTFEVRRVFVETNKCNGCRICELRCSFEHLNVFAPTYSRIQIEKNEFKGIDKPLVCKQCEKPYCIPACPQNAITKDPKTGILHVDPEKCDGCGLCVEACPFGAITLQPETKYALICDTCGGDPQCVKYCPENALHYFTASEYRAYKRTNKKNH